MSHGNLCLKMGDKMLSKSLTGLVASFVVIIFMCDCSFAQDDIDVELTTGGTAKCVFNGRVPFRRIKAASNNLVVDTQTGLTKVSIESELDTEKSTLNANLFAIIEATSDPTALLSGEEVEFQSTQFEFSVSKTRKSDGTTVEVTNETPEGERTSVTGNVLVKDFDFVGNKASGIIKMVFANTLRTISSLEEDIETDENGKVVVTCRFDKVPVNFSGNPDTVRR